MQPLSHHHLEPNPLLSRRSERSVSDYASYAAVCECDADLCNDPYASAAAASLPLSSSLLFSVLLLLLI